MAQANITSETFALDAEPTEAAFEATLPEIMALPDEETQAVNIDPVVAGTIVLGLLPELMALRPHSTPCSRHPPSRAGAKARRSTSASGSPPKAAAPRP